jgi:DNA-binding transcriptional ArsR family regulator
MLNIIHMPRVIGEPKSTMDAYEGVFTALAHPVRRRILMTINFEGGSMTAGAIAGMFEHKWPTTTRHLHVLESAELLREERDGRNRVYHINRKRLELLRDWLAWFSKDPK